MVKASGSRRMVSWKPFHQGRQTVTVPDPFRELREGKQRELRKQENGFPVTLPQGMQMVRAFWQRKSRLRPYSTTAVW